MRVVSNATLADNTMPAATEAETASVPVQPLVARDVAGELTSVEFDRPFVSGELSSVIVALIPNGAPSNTTSQPETVQAAATRNVSATYPVAATRAPLEQQITIHGRWDDDPSGVENSIQFQTTDTVAAILRTLVPGAGAFPYEWNSAVMSMPSSVVQSNVSGLVSMPISISFDYGGRRYYYKYTTLDESYGAPTLTASSRYEVRRPSSSTGDMYFGFSVAAGWTIVVNARSADGATLAVRIRGAEMEFLMPYGYLEPSEYWGIQGSVAYRSRAASDFANVGITATVVGGGYAYSFASSANETAMCPTAQSGTVSFVRNGVTWTADYSFSDQGTLGLRAKSTGSRISVRPL